MTYERKHRPKMSYKYTFEERELGAIVQASVYMWKPLKKGGIVPGKIVYRIRGFKSKRDQVCQLADQVCDLIEERGLSCLQGRKQETI